MTKATDPLQCYDLLQLQQEVITLRNEQVSLKATVANLLNQLSMALQTIAELRIENQTLRDEIARLKGTPPRPKIPPGGLENSGDESKGGSGNKGGSGRGKHPRSKKTGLIFHNINRLKPDTIPEGAIFKGTRKYDVQDLVCQAHNTRYEIERWLLPDGTYIEGQIPLHIQGHYGAALRAHVITLAHSCRVTEELILEQLHRYKIAISAGQLHAMLTENHANFHAEKADLLEAGIASGQIQTDDVGTRHCSENCYTNVICNEYFVHLTTTDSKNRINFLSILAQGRGEYCFNQDAYDYLTAYKDTEWLIQALKIRKDPVFHTQDPQKTFLEEFGHLSSNMIRLLTEAGLFASLIEHGVPKDLNVHSDDAPQFEIFKQSLCWIHEERHYRKLIPSHPELAAEIEKVRAGIWQLYQDLKTYKQSPDKLTRCQISEAFDALFKSEKPTPYCVLNGRLNLTYAKKDRLLFVLECPATPLHNNLSETGGRGAKVKSKISGGTRSDEGRQAWDTFGSLNLTCRRLGICFYEYLMDRLLVFDKIPNLGTIIRERVKAAKTSPPMFAEALGAILNAA
jgi:Transposase IS66 family